MLKNEHATMLRQVLSRTRSLRMENVIYLDLNGFRIPESGCVELALEILGQTFFIAKASTKFHVSPKKEVLYRLAYKIILQLSI